MEERKRRDPLLDVNQVSIRLNVSRRTVYRLIDSGDLPASKFGTAHCLRVKSSDVEFFKQQREEAEI